MPRLPSKIYFPSKNVSANVSCSIASLEKNACCSNAAFDNTERSLFSSETVEEWVIFLPVDTAQPFMLLI